MEKMKLSEQDMMLKNRASLQSIIKSHTARVKAIEDIYCFKFSPFQVGDFAIALEDGTGREYTVRVQSIAFIDKSNFMYTVQEYTQDCKTPLPRKIFRATLTGKNWRFCLRKIK